MEKRYPRVLMISRTAISQFNAQGAARGSWFREWPKSHLAHVYSAEAEGADYYCTNRYLLTGTERRFGRFFERLKKVATAESPTATPSNRPEGASGKSNPLGVRLRRWAKWLLVESGLWELLFPPKLSSQLEQWVTEFRPEVLYAAVTDLSYMRLARLISNRFGIPLCIHIDDDWPNTQYRDSCLGFIMFPLIDRSFRRTIAASTVCLSNSQAMSREYERRYGTRFEPLMMCDEPERYSEALPLRRVGEEQFLVVYSGNLELNRWQSAIDLLEAIDTLRNRGLPIEAAIYAGTLPEPAKPHFANYPWVRTERALGNDDVPGVLRGADLLFLTEGFSGEYHDYIRLSISAKSHIYMFSGTPTLVYGPAGVGVVEYARENGWADVVDHAGPEKLADEIERLYRDRKLREHLSGQAWANGRRYHDAHIVREWLRTTLLALCTEKRKSVVEEH